MSDTRNLSIILELKDRASSELKVFQNKLEQMEPAFKSMAVAGGAAFAAIGLGLGFSFKQASEAEAAFTRLNHILKTAVDATDEQVQSLVNQANALEKVGVISKEATMIAQGQLATFDLQAESIEKLIPSILDYAVAEKGAAVSADDLRGMTNGLAQALQGNFASLTRTGFVLDEATKELIANGTEAERTAALVKVLDSTYKGMNETARGTAQGGLIALKTQLGGIAETIGVSLLPIINSLTQKLLPVLEQVTTWIEKNPKLTLGILAAIAALAGIVAVIGTLGMLLITILPVITAMGVAFGLISVPLLVIVATLAAIIATLVFLYMKWDEIILGMQVVWEAFSNFIMTGVALVVGYVLTMLDMIFPSWHAAFTSLLTYNQHFWETIWGSISKFLSLVKDGWGLVVETMITNLNPLIDAFEYVVDLARQFISLMASIGGDFGKKIKSGLQGVGETLSGMISRGKRAIGVNDAVISPNGNIISTHPDDFLIATKDPSSLGGSGLTIVIKDNTLLDDDAGTRIGDMIIQRLQLSNKF